MSLHILIDMNLSPDWASLLRASGFSTTHWSTVGSPGALTESPTSIRSHSPSLRRVPWRDFRGAGWDSGRAFTLEGQ